jgi:hypothetical protein
MPIDQATSLVEIGAGFQAGGLVETCELRHSFWVQRTRALCMAQPRDATALQPLNLREFLGIYVKRLFSNNYCV